MIIILYIGAAGSGFKNVNNQILSQSPGSEKIDILVKLALGAFLFLFN